MVSASLPRALAPLVERAQRAAVLLDFDGSLSAIVDDPARARPLPEARAALARLVGRMGLVAIVSGRPVAMLESAVDVDGVILIGQYGLERRDAGGVVVDERVTPYADAIAVAAEEAERFLPGLLVERKGGVAVTVHWRTAPERDAEALRVVDEIAARHGLAVHPTRMAREVRPPLPVDKGTAVAGLLAGLHAAAYAGDDRADLPAFDALERLQGEGSLRHAVRIAVRSTEAPPALLARADVVVDGPRGLAALLGELADELSASSAPP